jgi:creatinine amidohydrolase
MSSHQFERMLPWQLQDELARRPVAYIPLGTYEWHGEHLPVGLDSLTSHGLCLSAAEADGGLVLPPLYYGTGGGHGDYPWSMMMPGAGEIEHQLDFTLARLESFGVKLAVLFSGHFPPEQLAMIDRLAAARGDAEMKVVSYAVNRMEGLQLGPDHAAIFETTLLAALHSELVQLERLPPLSQVTPKTDEDPFGPQRHDPEHELYGIFGPDPRLLNPAQVPELLQRSVNWLVAKVRENCQERGS